MLPHFGPLGASLGWCLTSFDRKCPSTSNHNFRAFQLSDFNQLMVVSFPWWLSARKCMYLSIIKVSLWLHLFCVSLNEAWVLIRSPKDNIQESGLTSTTWWLWGTELRLTSAWVAFPGGPPLWCVFVVQNYPLGFLSIFRYSLLSVWLLSSYQYPQRKVSRAFLNFPTMPLQHIFRCWKFQFPARLICFISTHTDHSFGVATAVRLPTRWQLQRNHFLIGLLPEVTDHWGMLFRVLLSLPVVICCLGSGLSCTWVCYMLLYICKDSTLLKFRFSTIKVWLKKGNFIPASFIPFPVLLPPPSSNQWTFFLFV